MFGFLIPLMVQQSQGQPPFGCMKPVVNNEIMGITYQPRISEPSTVGFPKMSFLGKPGCHPEKKKHMEKHVILGRSPEMKRDHSWRHFNSTDFCSALRVISGLPLSSLAPPGLPVFNDDIQKKIEGTIEPRKKKKLLLTIESWLLNRDSGILTMASYNPHITR